MKRVLIFISVIFCSCEKDDIKFNYSDFDAASGKQLIFMDSLKVYFFSGDNYIAGYYHIDLSAIEGKKLALKNITLFRNGTKFSDMAVPFLSNAQFYDYSHVPPGSYSYSMCYNDVNDKSGKLSNEITIHVP
jgi:hypothetical protein